MTPSLGENTQRIPRNTLRTRIYGSRFWVVTPNGAAIRAFREVRGLGLRRLAHLIGIDPSYLSRIETEERGAAAETLHAIALRLQIPVEAITRERACDHERAG
ncbi:helix-turn-helix domain-containing protein [Streptomyces bugieae]|uniref:helix-turn-helix domain-containing protein n=1 Tax=Streptomyces bugieae TaxID=3098223 RepID=UPI003B00AEE2